MYKRQVIDEASDFKFGTRLGFAKAHHQIPLEEKVELPEIWGFRFNISVTAEASDFKFGKQLGFTKAHHTITPKGKRGVALGYGSSHKFWVSLYFRNGWG